jgi:hypothetical protein
MKPRNKSARDNARLAYLGEPSPGYHVWCEMGGVGTDPRYARMMNYLIEMSDTDQQGFWHVGSESFAHFGYPDAVVNLIRNHHSFMNP